MNYELVTKAIEEHGTVVNGIAAGVEEFKKSTQDEMNILRDEITNLSQMATPYPGGGQPAKKGLSQAIASDGMRAFQNRSVKSAQIPLQLSVKALVGDVVGVGNDLYGAQAQRDGGIGEDARRSIRLLDLLPRMSVNSNTLEFVALDSFTSAADYQGAEGDEKAEQTVATELQTAGIVTVAALLTASEQVLADSPILAQFLDSKLRFGLLDKLERELIAGPGTTGTIKGLVAHATAATTPATAPADKIGEALTQLEIAGWRGGLVILHPNDWQAIRAERGTSNDGYIAGGWASAAGSMMWNVPSLTSSSLTEGTALVLDPAQMALLDRQSVMLEVGHVGTQFAQNLVTLRAELRAGMAVFSPSAILKVSL